MQETDNQLQSIINREQASIRGSEEDREASGWFGKFNRLKMPKYLRWVPIGTESDPYELDIKNARQKISTAEYAKTFLEQSRNAKSPEESAEFVNKARRIAGMAELNSDFTISDNKPVSRGLNRVDTDTQRYENEQEAITVSRDVAISGAVTVGTLGGGAIAGSLAKGGHVAVQTAWEAAKTGAIMGGTTGALSATGKGIDDVNRGAKTISQAVGAGAIDTAIGAIGGAVLGLGARNLLSMFELRPAVDVGGGRKLLMLPPRGNLSEAQWVNVLKSLKTVELRELQTFLVGEEAKKAGITVASEILSKIAEEIAKRRLAA